MKLLFEGWRKFLKEDEDKEKIEKAVEDTLDDEGGAAGLEPLVKAAQKIDPDVSDDDVKQMIAGIKGVTQHKKGDYIDTEELAEVTKVFLEMKEDLLDEKRKRKKSKKKKAKKRDACYHKVKARYKVWPSAYASGALVKCRKVGAKNWGTGGKKKK